MAYLKKEECLISRTKSGISAERRVVYQQREEWHNSKEEWHISKGKGGISAEKLVAYQQREEL